MKIYLVKIGKDILEYELISDNLSLVELNGKLRCWWRINSRLLSFPALNNNDCELIKNSGGTVLYRDNDIIYWLINIEHIRNESVSIIIGKRLATIIDNMISSIKRDVKINSII